MCVGEEEESSPVHVRVVGDAVGRGLRSKSVSENVEAEDGAYEGRERSSFSGAVGRTGDADLRDLIKGGGVGGGTSAGATGAADAGGGVGRVVGNPEGEKDGNTAPDWESSIRSPSSG